MIKCFFHQQVSPSPPSNINRKIDQAIHIIQSNGSKEADKTLEIIDKAQLQFRSYFELSKEEYENCCSDIKLIEGIDLPEEFPPTDEAVSIIEKIYPGSIYGNVIYLSLQLSAKMLALIIVHEICHFRTETCYENDKEKYDEQTADFIHEFRAVASEYRFQNHINRLSHDDIEEILADTADRYPDLVNDESYDACFASAGMCLSM